MFEGLKKKFSTFIGTLSGKEQEKIEEESISESKEKIREIKDAGNEKEEVKTAPILTAPSEPNLTKAPARIEDTRKEANTGRKAEKPRPAAPEPDAKPVPEHLPAPVHATRPQGLPSEKPHPANRYGPDTTEETKPVTPPPPPSLPRGKPPSEATHASAGSPAQPKVTFGTRLKGIFTSEIKISEKDADPFLETLRLSLLESDVNYAASEKIISEIRKELLSSTINSRGLEREIAAIIRNAIARTLDKGTGKSLPESIREFPAIGTPFTILFIGPNGAGKTTTIAKVANLLLKSGISCIISASDTFRAAAIEQTVFHAQKLGIEVVKGKYGADPASIAFDAVAHAKAEGINVVLIDSAGRQETNKNLMEEMKKMVRVAKPNMKIFIGEAITGNSLLEQVRQFNEAIGIDGVIITKLDADAKGGNTLSILSETDVPILYFGTGEGYDDLMKYDPAFMAESLIPGTPN